MIDEHPKIVPFLVGAVALIISAISYLASIIIGNLYASIILFTFLLLTYHLSSTIRRKIDGRNFMSIEKYKTPDIKNIIPEDVGVFAIETENDMFYDPLYKRIGISVEILNDYEEGEISKDSFLSVLHHEIKHHDDRVIARAMHHSIFLITSVLIGYASSYNLLPYGVIMIVAGILFLHFATNLVTMWSEMRADRYSKKMMGLEPICTFYYMPTNKKVPIYEYLTYSYPAAKHRSTWLIGSEKEKETVENIERNWTIEKIE